MPKIGFDARMIEHSGIGVRIQKILKYWKSPSSDSELILFGDPTVLKKYPFLDGYTVVDYTAPIYSLAELWGHNAMRGCDVLEIPHFNAPIPYLQKSIVTIHDLIPLRLQQFHSSILKRIYLWIVLRLVSTFAKQIVAVSQFTKDDFVKEFPKTIERIQVVYNAVDKDIFQIQESREVQHFLQKYNLPDSYLLTVGIGKGHKNFSFLMESILDLWNRGIETPPLVLGGTGGKYPEGVTEVPENWKSRVILMPRLKEHELPLLYQSATALVYPSMFEGFGFPVLEAQAMGCPVLSSNATVLPEILGNSALFFDPTQMVDLQMKLLHLLKEKSIRDVLVKAGKKNYQRFDWETSASLLQTIHSSGRG